MTKHNAAPIVDRPLVNVLAPREGSPDFVLADAEVIFGPCAGAFFGCKLIGCTVKRDRQGTIFVQLPGGRFKGRDGHLHNYSVLKPVDEGAEPAIEAVKRLILDAYERWIEAADEP